MLETKLLHPCYPSGEFAGFAECGWMNYVACQSWDRQDFDRIILFSAADPDENFWGVVIHGIMYMTNEKFKNVFTNFKTLDMFDKINNPTLNKNTA